MPTQRDIARQSAHAIRYLSLAITKLRKLQRGSGTMRRATLKRLLSDLTYESAHGCCATLTLEKMFFPDQDVVAAPAEPEPVADRHVQIRRLNNLLPPAAIDPNASPWPSGDDSDSAMLHGQGTRPAAELDADGDQLPLFGPPPDRALAIASRRQ